MISSVDGMTPAQKIGQKYAQVAVPDSVGWTLCGGLEPGRSRLWCRCGEGTGTRSKTIIPPICQAPVVLYLHSLVLVFIKSL